MKIKHPINLSIIAAASFVLAGCGEKKDTPGGGSSSSSTPAVDEKTAIENFKKEVVAMGQWFEAKQKEMVAAKDPSAGMAMVGEMVAKFKSIKTDGLPADFKTAWTEMTAVVGEMGDVMKSMPKIDPAKPDEAMKAMAEMGPKMQAIQAKIEPASKKLDELGKKYGFDGLDKLMPK